MKYIVTIPTEKYKPCLRWAKTLSESEFSKFKNFQNENQNKMLKII